MIFDLAKHKRVYAWQGMSIVELVIVVGILAAISGIVGTFQAGVFRMNRQFGGSVSAVLDANRAAKDIVTNARALTQSSDGSFPVHTAASSTFAFYVDSDGDGLRERFRYFLSGNVLNRGIIIPVGSPPVYDSANEQITMLAKGVANASDTPMFSYFDRSFSGTTTPMSYPINVSSVRHIRATFVMDEDPNQPPTPIIVRTAVTFRNLKDN